MDQGMRSRARAGRAEAGDHGAVKAPGRDAIKATLALCAGVALGIAAAAADRSIGGTSDAVRVMLWIPNIGSLWVALAFLASAWLDCPWRSVLLGCGALVAAVCAYYAYGLTLGDRTGVGLHAILPTLAKWLVAAVVAGPVFGLSGFLFRTSRGGAGLLGAVAFPAVIIIESGYQLVHELPYFANDPWRDGLLVVMILVGLALVVLFVRRWALKLRDVRET